MHDCVQRIDGVFACESPLARQHFEQDRAQGKQVGTAICLTALNLFGREVAGGPKEDSSECRRTAVASYGIWRKFRYAEIEDLGDARTREKDILGLEITMNEPRAMCGNESSADVDADSTGFAAVAVRYQFDSD